MMFNDTIIVQCKCGQRIQLIKPDPMPPPDHWYWKCTDCVRSDREKRNQIEWCKANQLDSQIEKDLTNDPENSKLSTLLGEQ